MRNFTHQFRRFSALRLTELALLVGVMMFVILAPKTFAAAGIYRPINYQGKLSSTGGLAITNGQYNMRFKIFNAATGGVPAWTETWNDSSTRVTSTGGLFSIALGSITTMTGSVDFNSDSLYLQVEFDPGNDGVYEEVFAPRRRFASVPYAHNANTVDGLDSTQFIRSDADATASGTITVRTRSAAKIGIDIISNGGSTATGALRLSTAGGPAIVFGSGGVSYDTNLYRTSANTLKTDDALQVVGTLSGSRLVISGNANVSGALLVRNNITTRGTLSGYNLTVSRSASISGTLIVKTGITSKGSVSGSTIDGFGLGSCSGSFQKLLYNATTDKFECGSISTASTFGTGNVITIGDARYLKRSGGTMTGQLIVDITGGDFNTVGLKVINTLSGAHLHAERLLTTSGSLRVEGTASFQTTTDSTTGFQILDANGGDPVFNVDTASERVGIGISAPSAQLHVYNSATSADLVIESDASNASIYLDAATNSTSAIYMKENGNPRWAVGSIGANDSFSIAESSFGTDDRLTILSAGNIGIGTTTPGSKLSVSGAVLINPNGNISSSSADAGLALEIIGTASGQNLYATRSITGSHLYAAQTFNGAGLADCDTSGTSKLLWDSTTKRFSCGTDANAGTFGTGNVITIGDARYVNQSGDTMTGSLIVQATMSGRHLIISQTASISGSLIVVGNITTRGTLSGYNLTVSRSASISGTLIVKTGITSKGSVSGSTIDGFGLGSCNSGTSKLLYNSTTDKFECGTISASASSFSTGNVLTIGDARYLKRSGGTMTGQLIVDITGGNGNTIGLKVINTASGRQIHAEQLLTSSGKLIVSSTVTHPIASFSNSGADTAISLQIRNAGVTGAYLNASSTKASGTQANDNSIGGSVAWSNPSNVTTSDDADATVSTLYAEEFSQYLKTTNYGFGIPANAVVDGIAVSVERSRAANDSITDKAVRIVKGGSISSTDRSSVNSWSTTDTVATYGGPSDLWGETWNTTDINSSNFGFAISAQNPCSTFCNGTDPSIDYIEVTVYYHTSSTFADSTNWTFGIDRSDSSKFKIAGSTTLGTNDIFTATLTGSVGIGTVAPRTKLEVAGTISGSRLIISGHTNISGALLVLNNITTRGTLSGYNLTVSRSASISGTLIVKTGITSKGSVSGSTIDGFGLGDCSSGTSKLLYNSTTDKFECGTISASASSFSTGNVITIGDARYVNQSGDTMTGALLVKANLSGSRLIISENANISGALLVVGNITTRGTLSGYNLTVSRSASISGTLIVKTSITSKGSVSGSSLFGFGLGDCSSSSKKLTYNNSTGKFSCQDDLTTGSGLEYSTASAIFVNQSGDTMTGALVIDLTGGNPSSLGLNVKNTISGSRLIVSGHANITGSLLVVGNITTRGTLSGMNLTVSRSASISGTLIVKTGITSKGSVSGSSLFGFGLGDCSNATTSKLIYNNSTGQFACATDQTGGGTSGGLGFSDAEGIYVNQKGDTMTGALLVKANLSGSRLIISENANISGALLVVGNITTRGTLSGYNLTVSRSASISGTLIVKTGITSKGSVSGSTIDGFGLGDCSSGTSKLLYNSTTDKFECGTISAGSSTFGTGNVLTIGDSRYVNQSGDTMTGALVIEITGGNYSTLGLDVNHTISGARLIVSGNTSLSGALTVARQILGDSSDAVNLPGFSWSGDPNTGMYRPVADSIGFAIGGVNHLNLNAAGAQIDGELTASASIAASALNIGSLSVGTDGSSVASLHAMGGLSAYVLPNGSQIYYDTFTEGVTTTLASHTPDTGTSWTILTQNVAATMRAQSTGKADATATVTNGGILYTADGTYPTADYEVKVRADVVTTGTNVGILAARIQDASNMYAFKFSGTAANNGLYKQVGGVWTLLHAASSQLFVAADTIRLRVVGTDITVYKNNLLIASASDSDISAAGTAGLGLGNIIVSTDDVNTAWDLDEFAVTTYVNSGLPSAVFENGFVGIDTRSPGSMLSVSGSAIIGRAIGSYAADTGATLEVIGNMSGSRLTISNNANISGALLVLNGITTRGTLSGSNLTVSRSASISGTLIVKTSITSKGSVSGSSLFGFGLGDCSNATTSKLIYSNSTGQFSCATDQTGGGTSGGLGFSDAQGIYVNQSGDTMTGALLVKANLSGSRLIISENANISGALLVKGNIATRGTLSGTFLTIQSSGTVSGTLLVKGTLATKGTLSGGNLTVMANANSYIMGSLGLGTTTIDTGVKLEIIGTASGRVLQAEKILTSSGLLMVTQSQRRGSGALVVDQRTNSTGAYITGTGSRAPLLVLEKRGFQNTQSPHILFGYNGTFDVSMRRSAAGTLAISGSVIIDNTLAVQVYGAATATTVCRTSTGMLAACSSSLRYKEDVQDLQMGLDTIRQMRVVDFKWKDRDQRDFGFIAEEMEQINPMLVEYDNQGQVQGVKYMQLSAVLTNAVNTLDVRLLGITNDSGSVLHARELLTSSGALKVVGFSTFGSGILLDTKYTDGRSDVVTIKTNVGGTGNTVFRIDASGAVFSDSTFNSQGADYAEWFKDGGQTGENQSVPLVAGELVCIDIFQNNAVRRCERGADPNVMGIISTNPAFIGNAIRGADGMRNTSGYVLVGLIGQVPAKVNLDGGNIRPGDSLTSAARPGYARRALAGESTVGVALEAFDGSTSLTTGGTQNPVINVLISRRNQSLTVESVEQKVLDSITSMNLSDEIQQMVQSVSQRVNLDDRVLATLTAQIATLDLSDKINDAIDTRFSGAALTVQGALSPEQIALIASAVQAYSSASGSDVAAHRALVQGLSERVLRLESVFSGSLLRVQAADIGTLTVRGSASFGSGITVVGNSTIGPMTLSGNAVTIGSLMSSGSLTVVGPITVSGLAEFLGDVHIKGELVLSNRQAGFAVITKTGTSVTVTFDTALSGTPSVNVTPQGRVGSEWWVEHSSMTGFTVRAADPVTQDIRFSWTALASIDPETVHGAAASSAPAVTAFPVNALGQPVSSDAVWNGCIQGHPLLDSEGHPLSCARYHDDFVWQHPDLGISFTYNPNHEPPILALPEGYSATQIEPVASSASSSASSESSLSSSSSSSESSESSVSSSSSSDSSVSSSVSSSTSSESSSSSSVSSESSSSSSESSVSSSTSSESSEASSEPPEEVPPTTESADPAPAPTEGE